MKDVVFVKGNIRFKSGNHMVKELCAYADDEWERVAEYVINEDLIITDKDVLKPYTIYFASEDIIFENITFEEFVLGDSVVQRPDNVIRIFKDEISYLQRLKDQKTDTELVPVLNRQIYIGVVGTMELFLSDFLYCMVLGNRKYYDRFCANSSWTISLREITTKGWKVQDEVGRAILETNYHRLVEIANIYKKVLGLEFPSTENLKRHILTRHNLIHRNGYPTKTSKYKKIDHNMIDDLIKEVQILVDYIVEKKKMTIKKWLPELEKE